MGLMYLMYSTNDRDLKEQIVGAGLASARNNDFELSSLLGRISKQQWQNIPNLYDDIEEGRADARPAPTVNLIISFILKVDKIN